MSMSGIVVIDVSVLVLIYEYGVKTVCSVEALRDGYSEVDHA